MIPTFPPVLPAPALPRLFAPQRHRIANGIEVLLVERHELPIVDVQVIIRGGAAQDHPTFAGRAYMVAGLLDQGAGHRDALEIAADTEQLGASIECRASWDFTGIALHVLTARLEPALDVLADITVRPTFPAAELERKREERLAAILQDQDEPRVLANQRFARNVFGAEHPFGNPLGGTAQSIQRLTLADVRAFHRERFAPERACIVVAGDVAPETILPLLDARFGSWTAGIASQLPGSEPRALPQSARAVHIVDRPGAPQSELRVGTAGPPRATPEFFALLVANTVLGGSFTSRLNLRLREEKAYTYGASSNFSFRRDGGPFLAATAVGTNATADAVNDMVREIDRMTTEPVPAEELERAKQYIVLGLPRRFETTADIAEQLGELALFDLGDNYFERFAANISAVTADDVRAAAARWLTAGQLSVVIAGDAEATRDELASLGFGPVREHDGD